MKNIEEKDNHEEHINDYEKIKYEKKTEYYYI